MTDVSERWNDWTYDGRGWYLTNDPEVTFYGEEEAMAYCDEHNRALIGQVVREERARIINIVNKRMALHNDFIDGCVDNDVRVSDSFFIALSELRSLLREIEK